MHKGLLFLLLLITAPISLANINNPNITRLVNRIEAPDYINKQLYEGLFKYIFAKIITYQTVVEKCMLLDKENSGSCRKQTIELSSQEKLIKKITIKPQELEIILKEYEKLGIIEDTNIILHAGNYDGTIIWQALGSIFNLIPENPKSGIYFCPKPEEINKIFDGRTFLIDEQRLKWKINNPKKLGNSSTEPLSLQLVSITRAQDNVFCTYKNYTTISILDNKNLKISGQGKSWSGDNYVGYGFCRGMGSKDIREDCAFKIED